MDLGSYLQANNLDWADFADRLGVSYETVRRYVRGERIPDTPRMKKIVAETGGAVQPNDFYDTGAAA